MRYPLSISVLGALLFQCLALALPQGPNTVAPNNPNLRTQSSNQTWFLLALPKTSVQAVVSNPLLPVPSDPALFPAGFPAGKHPVLVSSGFGNDIRMGPLFIQSLMQGSVQVPYVDRLNDGKTAFLAGVRQYIGGTDQYELGGIVPSIVGSLETFAPLYRASFTPKTAAYATLPNSQFSSQLRKILLLNQVSGPSVAPSAFDLQFSAATNPPYTARAFHSAINQPNLLGNGLCQRNTVYFNETFTDPKFRKGKITLYDGSIPQSLVGIYDDVPGYSANGELIGYNPETCEVAAQRNDPAASL